VAGSHVGNIGSPGGQASEIQVGTHIAIETP